VNEKAKTGDTSGFVKHFSSGGRSSARSFTPKKTSPTVEQSSQSFNTVKEETNTKDTDTNKGPVMKQDSTSRKMCAICSFWTGNRAFKSAAGNFFEYEDASAKCSPNGGRPNTMMSPRTGNMPCFQKWGG